jgi:hypothetical protein
MLRRIGGVVLGYITMAAVVFIGLTAAWYALGADRAFRPGVYDVSTLWIALSLVIGFVAALLGGIVVRRISRSVGATYALALLVIVLGVASALPMMVDEPVASAVRTGVPGMTEAMRQARTPLWVMLLQSLIGAVGVLVGGRAIGRSPRAVTELGLHA